MGKKPWYSEGLAFECTGCGGCCTGAPGFVWVTKDEMQAIAEYLDLPDGILTKEYVRRVRLKHSLTELEDGDCVFLRWKDGKGTCAIYPVRPVQCRTWPFWDYNLKSEKNWRAIGKGCPGIDQGTHHSYDQIEKRREQVW